MHLGRVPTHILPFAVAVVVIFALSRQSAASVLIGVPEQQEWSDMAFPNVVSGGFNAGTQILSLTSAASNDLELGAQFGPLNPGKHYGTGGTLGGPFSATLFVSGVVIQPNGAVTNGGSVSIVFNGGAPGSIGTDYGIGAGSSLLSGYVLETGLNATGAGTLDVLFRITGGALQNYNPGASANFAVAEAGLLRFGSRTPLAGDFSTGFSLAGTTVDALGVIPEFPYTTLVLFSAIVVIGAVLRRDSVCPILNTRKQ